MERSLTASPGAAGRLARTLLAALALAACGGGDEERASGDTPGDTTAAAQAALAADSCTGPPPAFGQAVFEGAWQALLDSLGAHNVTFPEIEYNSDTAAIVMCDSCSRVRVEIRSSNRTFCLQPDDLTGEARILGLFILLDTFPAQFGWDTIPAGDTIFTFAHTGIPRPATLAYRHDDRVRLAPRGTWGFAYCEDGERGTHPQAQWRDRHDTIPSNTPPGQAEEVEEGEAETRYGWMACASGCCQFYSTPPTTDPITTPGKANPKAPDTVGKGHNQGPGRNCVFPRPK